MLPAGTDEHSYAACGTMSQGNAHYLMSGKMTGKLFLPLTLIFLGALVPVHGWAQSDSGDTPLGDLARQYRKGKAAIEHAVIDNDNLESHSALRAE